MSRPLRIKYSNAFYHVMNRGNNRQPIFLNDHDYEIFLETLKETSRLFDIKVLSFCLMVNHYHLLLCTPRANLSRAMRHLNGIYTQRFNRRHKKDGHLFRGRYKAILVQEDEYLTHLIRYIHLNPVQDPKNYLYSSHKQYMKAEDETPWLHVRTGLAFFSSKLSEARKAYLAFIDQGIDPQTQKFYSGKNQSSILGDLDFLNDIKEKYLFNNQKLTTEIPEERRLSGQVRFRIPGTHTNYLVTREMLRYVSLGRIGMCTQNMRKNWYVYPELPRTCAKVARPTVSQALERLMQLKKIERIGMGRTTRYKRTIGQKKDFVDIEEW